MSHILDRFQIYPIAYKILDYVFNLPVYIFFDVCPCKSRNLKLFFMAVFTRSCFVKNVHISFFRSQVQGS